jgi:hypothetical protein
LAAKAFAQQKSTAFSPLHLALEGFKVVVINMVWLLHWCKSSYFQLSPMKPRVGVQRLPSTGQFTEKISMLFYGISVLYI